MLCFSWFVCRVSRKVGSLKRRVRSHVVRGEIKNCTPLWREAHFEVKMLKNWGVRSTFWSWDVEKLHAALARSTFWSENAKKLRGSEHFLKLRCWKIARRCAEKRISKSKCTKHCMFGPLFEVQMRCRKIARRCGEKHILKSKCTKHVSFGPLLEVTMSKNCTPLWREAHFQVKMLKNWLSRSTFWSSAVEKLHATVARSTFVSQNVQNTCVLAHFLKFRCRKISQVVS